MSQNKLSTYALFLAIFIDSLGWGVAFPILVPIVLENAPGLFPSEMSLILRNFWYEFMIGIYCLFMFIMAPLLGSLSDHYGRKRILIYCLLGNSLGFLIGGLSLLLNSLGIFILGRAIAGATAGSFATAQAAMIDISTSNTKTKNLGIISLANLSGFACGPFLGGFLLNGRIWGANIHYSVPFWVNSIIAFLGILVIIICFKESFNKTQQKIHFQREFLNLIDAFMLKATRKLCFVFCLFMLGWALFASFLPLLLTEKFNWHATTIGYFMGFIAVLSGISVLVIAPWLMKKFTTINLVMVALIAMVVCSLLLKLSTNPDWLWALIILTGAVPLIYVGLITLLSNTVNKDQ